MNKIALTFILLLNTFLFAQTSSLSNVDRANSAYIQGDYYTAFNIINQYFKELDSNTPEDKAIVIGEKIYFYYLRSLFLNDDFKDFDTLEKTINSNKILLSKRVLNALNILNNNEDLDGDGVVDNIEIPDILTEETQDSTTGYSSGELALMLKKSLLDSEKNAQNVSRVNSILMILLGVILLISLLIITVLYKSKKRKSYNHRDSLPAHIGLSDESRSKIDELISTCKRIGLTIDQATGRKNTSVNSAELVYKISMDLGYKKEDSILYYTATLVYDIGLLGVDKNILQNSSISDEDFIEIKKHVEYAKDSLNFVPSEYIDLFIDASTKHHENMDGSGYPYGLVDGEIPYIARVIRVVESYLSLVSIREYKDIRDKKAAMESLVSEVDKYDKKIVESLFEVV